MDQQPKQDKDERPSSSSSSSKPAPRPPSNFNKKISILPSHVTNVLQCAQFVLAELSLEHQQHQQQQQHKRQRQNKAQRQAEEGIDLDRTNISVDAFEDEFEFFDEIEDDDDDKEYEEQEELEDALDDGFIIIDVNVVYHKLLKWYELFPNIIPFFAIKCNPDAMIVHWLSSLLLVKQQEQHQTKEEEEEAKEESPSSTFDLKHHLEVGFDCASLKELQLAHDALIYNDTYSNVSNNDKNDNNNENTTTTYNPLILHPRYQLSRKDQQQQEEEQHPFSNVNIIPKIVYANPQRAEADLTKSLELFFSQEQEQQQQQQRSDGSNTTPMPLWLTLDGKEELYKIHQAIQNYMKSKNDDDDNKNTTGNDAVPPPNIELIIRIVVPDTSSQVPLGEKFGIDIDFTANDTVDRYEKEGQNDDDAIRTTTTTKNNSSSKFIELLSIANELQLLYNIIGISFHCGSGCHDPYTYQIAINMAQKAMKYIDFYKNEKYYNDRNNNLLQQERKQGEEKNITLLPKQKPKPCWVLDIGGGFPGWDGLGGDVGRFSSTTSQQSSPSSTAATAGGDDDKVDEKKEETTLDIATVIRPQLQRLQDEYINEQRRRRQQHCDDENQSSSPFLFVMAEPGRYFVEGSAILVSRIYKVQDFLMTTTKDNNDNTTMIQREYKIAHGVHGVFKDVLLCQEIFIPLPLFCPSSSSSSKEESKERERQGILVPSRVVGPTSSNHHHHDSQGTNDGAGAGNNSNDIDIVCSKCWLPNTLQVGDCLVFDRMGAYTLSIASRSGQPNVRYVQGGTF